MTTKKLHLNSKVNIDWLAFFGKKKRVAGILYLCYRTRIAMEFNFEFGFKESNLKRRSFHGGALIEAYTVSSSPANF